MPLTPRFDLRQTDTHVLVTVHVPTIRITNDSIEIVLLEDDTQLHFYAAPYLLKLNFAPRQFHNPDDDHFGGGDNGGNDVPSLAAQYDPSSQTVTIPLRKRQEGNVTTTNNNNNSNHWPNLDLTARLMQPKEVPKRWLHSVIDSQDHDNTINNDDENDCDQDDDDNDDAVQQDELNPRLPSLLSSSSTTTAPTTHGYGFANMYQNIFSDYCRSGLASEVFQLQNDPGHVSSYERRQQRLVKEKDDFDIDHYWQDIDLPQNDDYMYPSVIKYNPWWLTHGDRGDRHSHRHRHRRGDDDPTINVLTEQFTSTITLSEVRGELEEGDGKGIITEMSTTIRSHAHQSNNSLCTTSKQPTDGEPPLSHPTIPAPPTLFTPDERLLLSTIPYPLLPRSLLVPGGGHDRCRRHNDPHFGLWCGVIDLLLAYTYDHLFTMGEPTVESAWTIVTLSPRLSWLDDGGTGNGDHNQDDDDHDNNNKNIPTVFGTVVDFVRRCVTYPYWRNIHFAIDIVARRTLLLLQRTGISGITKALLQVRTILDKNEWYYIHNKIWIDPYLYWIQHQEEEYDDDVGMFEQVIAELEEILRDDDSGGGGGRRRLKEAVGLDLVRHEQEYQKRIVNGDDDEEQESNNSNESDDDDDDDDDDDGSDNDDISSNITSPARDGNKGEDDEGTEEPGIATSIAGDKSKTPIATQWDECPSGTTNHGDMQYEGDRRPSQPLIGSPFQFLVNAVNENESTITTSTVVTNTTQQQSSQTRTRKLIEEVTSRP